MNPVFKSRLKKVFWVALLIGFTAAALMGTIVWHGTNPQDEFHVDGVPTFEFFRILLAAFLPVTSAVVVISSPIVYFFSRSPSKS